MWLFTSMGFYSVVAHRDKPDHVLIRSRCRADLERLQELASVNYVLLAQREILENAGSDYRYRIIAHRRDWEWLVPALMREIVYDNFKNEVHKLGEPARDEMHNQVWLAGKRWQDSKLSISMSIPDRIVCPQCKTEQDAVVRAGQGGGRPAYVHTCVQCGYVITKSEWKSVITKEEAGW